MATTESARWLDLIRAHGGDDNSAALGTAITRLARLAVAEHACQAAGCAHGGDENRINGNAPADLPTVLPAPLSHAELVMLHGSAITEDGR